MEFVWKRNKKGEITGGTLYWDRPSPKRRRSKVSAPAPSVEYCRCGTVLPYESFGEARSCETCGKRVPVDTPF